MVDNRKYNLLTSVLAVVLFAVAFWLTVAMIVIILCGV